jgi:RNA-splicing ligase RtcB
MEQLAKKLMSWASILEPQTREQAQRTASMPFIWPHLALMPDCHLGKGATIGSVIPTLGAIMPACVGVDIGCGMIAVRTGLFHDDLRGKPLARLRESIEKAVPLSAGQYNGAVHDTGTQARVAELEARDGADSAQSVAPNWRLQLGSLGSGNHFIELSLDEKDRVWLFLHSGSRGVGNKLATRHIKVAQDWCDRAWIQLPDPDLAYLVEGSREFWSYLRDLRWAQHFALLNRAEMMARVTACLADFIGRDITPQETIQCFAGETEVMTRMGSRPIESLAGGVHELLTADGVWTKAPVRSFGRQEVSEVILSRSGVIKHIRATAEHKWLLRTRRGLEYEATTDQLRAGDRLQFSFPPRPQMTVDRSSAARGFVYGDGYRCSPGRSAANFHGAKDAALLPYFAGLGCPPHRYQYSQGGYSGTFTRITGLPAEWKTDTPPLSSNPSELYGWLAGYFAADGDVGKTGRPTLSSASRASLEYVRLLCQEIGIGTFGIRTRLRSGWGRPPSPMHLLGLMRNDLDPDFFLLAAHRSRFVASRDDRHGNAFGERRGWNVIGVRPTGETTEVYCAVVEGTHSFALADNILVGNCHHNYTEQLSDDLLAQWKGRPKGRSGHVWLSRKGAIDATAGKPGLIPGSMGTRSYVVTGKGNKLSLNSSPHGAGREYSRSAARRTFTRAELDAAMAGIEWRHTDAFLDEIPGAYKDIDVIMADAADLVDIRHTLRQIVNVKGE